jgi:hypothetical protein
MIPRILHQTWISDDVPPHLRAYRQSWLRNHPSWDHRLWTDADNFRLISERYPEFLPYFRSTVPPILRIDLVRLAYLHAFGGVYADLDYELLKPIDPLLDTHCAIAAREHGGIGTVMRGRDFIINALLASPPAHPLWIEVMRAMVARHRPRRLFERHTPYVVRMAIAMLDEHAERRASVDKDVTILAHQLVYPASPTTRVAAQRGHAGSVLASYGIHHYDNSWRTPLDRVVNVGRSLVQRLGH